VTGELSVRGLQPPHMQARLGPRLTACVPSKGIHHLTSSTPPGNTPGELADSQKSLLDGTLPVSELLHLYSYTSPDGGVCIIICLSDELNAYLLDGDEASAMHALGDR
jgi:hypothetical protein